MTSQPQVQAKSVNRTREPVGSLRSSTMHVQGTTMKTTPDRVPPTLFTAKLCPVA